MCSTLTRTILLIILSSNHLRQNVEKVKPMALHGPHVPFIICWYTRSLPINLKNREMSRITRGYSSSVTVVAVTIIISPFCAMGLVRPP